MKKISLIYLLLFILSINVSNSQTTQVVVGKVYTLNNLPVQGITVSANQSKGVTKTDSLGNFTISCMENDKLLVKGKVFKTTSVKIKPNQKDSVKIKVSFIPTEHNVDLAIGYGYIDEANRTTAIQGLESNRDYSSYSDIYTVLKQVCSGAIVNGDCVIIRGPGSNSDQNCALIIVDGMEYNTVESINPADIKNITVIKDGSSAIYGVRGANGVILIELKKANDSYVPVK